MNVAKTARSVASSALVLGLLFLLCTGGCILSRDQRAEPVLPLATPATRLPGRWMLVYVRGDDACRYEWVDAQNFSASHSPSPESVLTLPCTHVGKMATLGTTVLREGPCPPDVKTEGCMCWLAARLPTERHWQPTPLRSPIFLYGDAVLYPCGSTDAYTHWCRWNPDHPEQTSPYPSLQMPPETDPHLVMPLAWGPPWLLMGEEDDCEAGLGGKIWSVGRRYWLFNLTTGLPSPWPVWKAIGSQPRCLHEGESLEGYAQIDIIGWNPARPDELAFAARRFLGGYYEQPLDASPFRTEIYLWHANGRFVKIGAFPRLACGLWAPDGSGWLCRRLGLRGEVEDLVFLSREGEIAGQWRHPPDTAVLQWVP